MSPFALAFLVLMAASLLLVLAAVGRLVWRRLRPSALTSSAGNESPRTSSIADFLLLLAVAMSWYNVSSGWIAQLTIYPIYADMKAFGPQAFHGFGRGYLSRLPIIILPAGVMCLAWSLLLWLPSPNVPTRTVWIIVALCISFAAITPIPAGAQEQMYNDGFSPDLHARLLWSNGIRAVLFTVIGLLSLAALRSRWTSREPPGA
jgi:hypothetical protein